MKDEVLIDYIRSNQDECGDCCVFLVPMSEKFGCTTREVRRAVGSLRKQRLIKIYEADPGYGFIVGFSKSGLRAIQ